MRSAVHQMAYDKHERHRQPDQSALHGYCERYLGKEQPENEKLKRTAHYPVRHFAELFVVKGGIH